MILYVFLSAAAVCIYVYMGFFSLKLSVKSDINKFFSVCAFVSALWAGGYIFMIHPPTTGHVIAGFMLYSAGWHFLPPLTLIFVILLTRLFKPARIAPFAIIDLLLALVLYIFKIADILSLPTFCILNNAWIEIVSISNMNTIVWSIYATIHSVAIVLFLQVWRKNSTGKRRRLQSKIVSRFLIIAISAIAVQLVFLIIMKKNYPSFAPITSIIWCYGFWRAITKYGFLEFYPQLATNDVTERMKDAFIMTDENLLILNANEKFFELTGYKPSDVLNQPAPDFFQDDEDAFDKLLENRRLKEKTAIELQTHIIPSTSAKPSKEAEDPIPVSVESSALLDETGDLIGAIFLIQDMRPTFVLLNEIEERVKIEQELRYIRQNLETEIEKRSREIIVANNQLMNEVAERKKIGEDLKRERKFLEKIITLNPYGIMVTDKNGKPVVINEVLIKMLGDNLSSDFSVFNNPLLNSLGIQKQLKEVSKGKTVNFPLARFTPKDYNPKMKPVELSVNTVGFAIMDHKGKLQNMVFMFEDVTDKRVAEEKTQKALEKERELNELKTRFINIASHEFKTPLSTIMLFTDLIERHNADIPEEKKLGYFDKVRTAIRQMNQLLNDVLIIGKTDANKITFNPQPGDLKKFCADVIDDLLLSYSGKRVVRKSFHVTADATLFDEKLLRHILANLLSNAMKYSGDDTEIDFKVECDGRIAVFRVIDRGIGIEPDDLQKVFDTFHRGRNVGNIEGTGLGLTIVKRYVELHKGSVEVEKTGPEGAVFKVVIPVN